MIFLRVPEDLAAALKAARQANGLRLRDISDVSGVHPSNLSLYENGKFVPQLERVIRWANGCGYEVALVKKAEEGSQ